MYIAICEDLEEDADLLLKYVRQYFSEIHADCEIHIFGTGDAFLCEFAKRCFHIVFMDIYMKAGEADGMAAAKAICETDETCKIIFTTTSRDFGVDSHEVNAVHYLVKPISYEKLKTSLERCCDIIAKEMRFISVISNRSEIRLLLKDIYYIESLNKRLVIHTAKENIPTYMTLEQMENLLNSGVFLRCHKCYLVNMDHVSGIQEGDFLMKNGNTVMIRKRDSKTVKNIYTGYYFQKLREGRE